MRNKGLAHYANTGALAAYGCYHTGRVTLLWWSVRGSGWRAGGGLVLYGSYITYVWVRVVTSQRSAAKHNIVYGTQLLDVSMNRGPGNNEEKCTKNR